jgi:hypothetical protein
MSTWLVTAHDRTLRTTYAAHFLTRAIGCCAGTFDLLAYTSKDQDVPTDWWVPFDGGWGGTPGL